MSEAGVTVESSQSVQDVDDDDDERKYQEDDVDDADDESIALNQEHISMSDSDHECYEGTSVTSIDFVMLW